MRLLKKLGASMLGMLVMAGAIFSFVGCSEVKGKDYEFSALTYTVITAVSEETGEKEITETRTLTAREYYIVYVKEMVELADLATATLNEAQEKEFENWYEDQVKLAGASATTKYEFKGKEVHKIVDEVDEINGEIERSEKIYTYVEDKGVLTLTKDETSVIAPESEKYSEISLAYLVDGKLEVRDYKVTTTESYAVDTLLYVSYLYAEV